MALLNSSDYFLSVFSSPSEKDMLVSDQDIQVLYETCASKECTKACFNEVGLLWHS